MIYVVAIISLIAGFGVGYKVTMTECMGRLKHQSDLCMTGMVDIEKQSRSNIETLSKYCMGSIQDLKDACALSKGRVQ